MPGFLASHTIPFSQPNSSSAKNGSVQLDLLSILQANLAGRYVVDREIGRGGMATVFGARDLINDRAVAIKLLHPDLAMAVGGQRFLREIEILSRLSHPNILPLLEAGTLELVSGLEVPWYSMPWVEGETLRGQLKREGPLPIPVAVRYTQDLCAALGHAHREGFVHRDIKPENILIQGDQPVLADFGIARAVTVAGGAELSSTGIVVGTPTYMSPEQATGSAQLDGRSDLYSLGIVFYEMLAGHPPFTGSSPQAIGARHQFEQVPPIGVVRPGVTRQLASVLDHVLEKIPADRFATAGELSGSLTQAEATSPASPTRSRALAGILVTAVIVLGLWAGRSLLRNRGTGTDPALYAVVPFNTASSPQPVFLTGAECSSLLNNALGHWRDVRTVSELTIRSELSQRSETPSLASTLALARYLGAGRVIWGEALQREDSTVITGILYDTRTGREIKSQTIRLSSATSSATALGRGFAELAYELVASPGVRSLSLEDALGTSSLQAWRRFAAGDSALFEWNLELASRRFREALEVDPSFSRAALGVAQVDWLRDRPNSEWHDQIANAVESEAGLTPVDRTAARAILALSDNDYSGACAGFRRVIAHDSLDFRGWFGLADCQAKDDLVVGDSSSKSRWRFRSSYRSAISAYLHGLRLVPLSHRAFGGAAVTRLATLLQVEDNVRRFGVRGAADSIAFAAFPEISDDTLAFVPYPMPEILGSVPIPQTMALAVERNRDTLRVITEEWIARFPRSVPALEAYATVREMDGGAGPIWALDSAQAVLSRAEELASGTDRLRLQSAKVRLLVKRSAFREAEALADSLLARWTPANPFQAEILAGLAALIGRPDQAASLFATGSDGQDNRNQEGSPVRLSAGMRTEGRRFLAYAAFGAPAESILAIHQRLAGLADEHPDPDTRHALQAVTLRPDMLAFPHTPAPAGELTIYRIEKAIQVGDSALARKLFRRLLDYRGDERPAGITLDATLLESRLHLALGDTTTAREALRSVLDQPRRLGLYLINDLPQSAALGRAMALRAELAARAGDSGEALVWARATLALWRRPGLGLSSVTSRMGELASSLSQ